MAGKNRYHAGWIFMAFVMAVQWVACSDQNDKVNGKAAAEKEEWTCAMHPQIIRNHAGTCPVCGMDLVRKPTRAEPVRKPGLEDLQIPTDQFAISSIPVVRMQRKKISMDLDVFGRVSYDTREVNTISARIPGRIDKLYVRYRYQFIRKGDPIFRIYSPDLVTTEEELLFLMKNDPANAGLREAARQKLLLLGMSESQLQELERTQKASLTMTVYSNYTGILREAGNTMPEPDDPSPAMDDSRTTQALSVKEGTYVQKGENIFQVFDPAKAWVILNFFPGQEGALRQGAQVRIIPEAAPGKEFSGKVDFVEPFFRKDSKTLTARVYFDNSRRNIPVGSQVHATVKGYAHEANWLPRQSVISLGQDKIVFLKTADGFRAHRVETGLWYENDIEILSGIGASDGVAGNAQFLMDSESFIKAR